jgi:hypothetical protein
MPIIRRSHTAAKLFIALIIVFVLVVVGYFIAGQYYNLPYSNVLSEFSFFAPSPSTVINKMLTNMEEVSSSHMTVDGSVSLLGADGAEIGKFTLIVNGNSDVSDVNNVKSSFSFNISETNASSTEPKGVDISVMTVGQAIYFKLGNFNLSNITLSADQSELIGKTSNSWVKIDQESVTLLSQAENINLPDQLVNKQVQGFINGKDVLVIDKKLSDETINGKSTYHYQLKINKNKIQELVSKIIASEMESSPIVEESELTANVANAIAKTFIDAIGDIYIETWIGKDDFLLYQAKIDKNVNLASAFQPAGFGAMVSGNIAIKLSVLKSDFNKPVDVQAPETSQKIEELLAPILKTKKIKSALLKLSPLGQSSYITDKNYYALCYKGFLNGYNKTDGPALVQIANDIKAQGARNPTCFAGVQGFCVSTLLDNGKYLCIDEAGIVGEIQCVSSKTICGH